MNLNTSETGEKIMAAARDLFWKHGFRRVSIDEICRNAGISRMTYYRYFPNKTDLAKLVLKKVVGEGYDKFLSILAGEDSPEEKIGKILSLKFDGTHEISREFLNDFYFDQNSELHAYIQEISSDTWKKIISAIEDSKKTGIFRKDLNPAFFYFISQKMAEMLNNPEVLKLFDSPQDMIMESARLLLYGISPRKQ
ncbi:MAG: TetR/AcrR family transcriptional regulator [Bacteroidales bacterium]|jgi:AcrR family transcriptional regulator|nr:TetR/AcrR family transcriptional regulator [Bacteroidales bacterium]